MISISQVGQLTEPRKTIEGSGCSVCGQSSAAAAGNEGATKIGKTGSVRRGVVMVVVRRPTNTVNRRRAPVGSWLRCALPSRPPGGVASYKRGERAADRKQGRVR